MVGKRSDDAPRGGYCRDHEGGRNHPSVERFIDLRGAPLLPRRSDGAEEPRLELRREQRGRDPVDSVGNEVTCIEEESKELREYRQGPAEDIEDGTSGIVCTVKEAGDILQPRDRIPPAAHCAAHVR